MEVPVIEKEKKLTAAEYLAQERKGIREKDGKYEFLLGKLLPMGGASKEHNTISMNLSGLLWNLLQNETYQVFHSDMRTYTPKTDSYFYPDLVVVKGEPQFQDEKFDNLLNPFLIIEILSASTASFDRGEKFAAYRSIPSLQEYLTISSENLLAEHYVRIKENEWKITIYQQVEDTLPLLGGEVSLTLKEIYKNLSGIITPSKK
jgi:Uma2 family endonuclease